jgi:hypothetical protein
LPGAETFAVAAGTTRTTIAAQPAIILGRKSISVVVER